MGRGSVVGEGRSIHFLSPAEGGGQERVERPLAKGRALTISCEGSSETRPYLRAESMRTFLSASRSNARCGQGCPPVHTCYPIRLLRALRPERMCDSGRQDEPDRLTYFRPCRPRASRPELHEDHLPRPRSGLSRRGQNPN